MYMTIKFNNKMKELAKKDRIQRTMRVYNQDLIKWRTAINSERGQYIQDTHLRQSVFKPGTRYNYTLDVKNQTLTILPTTSGGNKVSRRKIKDGVKPVIDIRDKKALEMFEGSEKLQIQICNDFVRISVYEEQKQSQNEETVFSKLKSSISKVVSKSQKKISNVIKISEVLKKKKSTEILLSKKELRKAAGQSAFEQLSLFDYIDSTSAEEFDDTEKEQIENAEIALQVASLFSGAGIMDLGFKMHFDIKFALELDKDAVKTYRHNLGEHIVQADIKEYDKKMIPKVPVMIGGSPCQGFSNSNRYTNFLDNPNNELVLEYIKAVKANENCKVFVLENVPQILSAGEGKFKDEIYNALSDFEITSGVVNTAGVGGAQNRRRAIFIGSKIGRIDLPEENLEPTTVETAFKGLHDGIPNQVDYSKPRPLTVERMKHVPQGGNWEYLPDELKTERMLTKGVHSSVYKRLDMNSPAITITNPRKANITHPTENRSLSVRECARLFGVPDKFEFKGALDSMQQQLANAVPVHLAKAVSRKVKDAIVQYNIRNGHISLA